MTSAAGHESWLPPVAQPRPVWFRTAPPLRKGRFSDKVTAQGATPDQSVIHGNEFWSITQEPLRRQQAERPLERAVMPGALTVSVVLRLQDLEADLPDDLAALVNPTEPGNLIIANSQVDWLNIDSVWHLAVRRDFTTASIYTAMFDQSWLVALTPLGADPTLVRL